MKTSPIHLQSIASLFVGGKTAVLSDLPVEHRSMVLNGAPREVNPNGHHVYGQMYAQHFKLASPRHSLPVLLWHGGGMTGATWETTPDGRPGWLWRFLEAGYDVFCCDAAERGRASFAMSPHIYREPPVFRTAEEGWKTFRLGLRYAADSAERHVFPGQRFPVACFDEFTKQWVPRWPAHEAMILQAYEALVERVGECIVVAHSQGAGFAVEIARRRPELVRRVVAVEPGGMPDALPSRGLPPHLVVWGDHIVPSGSHWMGYRKQADNYFAVVAETSDITTLDLPAKGIRGNSHFPMMDSNSDEVFQDIAAWLER
ncbi:alpha/beta fold hydrolase [Variovorax ginsengisoli]|uniref:Pimeloyl-ACP methyl ester carboxylesterase n=1 Tax=Variovorax ginsengisoli TaxID=363844 RepID=A0ABT9S428_9BURK|nr:alpha/beta fold hydrolase [Variovorax ginsengisoli]MDP9899099.1 pimeloyl-ACP methyl ester carboxylesterase [Variovorax ginsengisoli]